MGAARRQRRAGRRGARAGMSGGTGGGRRAERVALRTARGRAPGSQRWLARQLNDPYVQAAQREGWRSRAAFKLLELDDRFHLIRPGARVIDLGAAPGGWTQAALRRGAGRVVALDLLPLDPIPGAETVQGDFAAPGMAERLAELLGGAADLVLSDMAPNATGHAATDHIRIMALAEAALEFSRSVLAPGGGFVAKVLQGGSER
ncbi:MAG: RlmE family RNA methyltransferase, partial [Alphaproteobacteria bacterium]|nr:RlmE family RNA methyltransferase [Alphaproteobacteria bacterium]